MKDTVFLGCPTHNGQVDHRAINALLCDATVHYDKVMTKIRTSSLLAHNCNYLYCEALNGRQRYGFKWFAMLHADVVPETNWLDKLIEIAEQGDYDMVAAHSPIKSFDGLTSTAIEDGGRKCRFTNHEIAQFELDEFDSGLFAQDTFLLLNTACMVVRIDQPWSHRLLFNITDTIVENKGHFEARVFSEDWHFSKMVQQFGGRVAATRQVKLEHIGQHAYSINTPGKFKVDPDSKK